MKQFNVIQDDEDFIGKPPNLTNMFLYEIGRQVQDKTLVVEDKIHNLELMVDILKEIQEINNNVVIRIKYNPMGTFYIADL